MRLSLLEMEGFRGVRARLRIKVPDGFLVVTGRNGSGKSTLCDAVEYALTGALSKYEDAKERGESTEQYVWWRGTRPALHKFVRVGVRDDAGREFFVTRTPESLVVSDGLDLAGTLCDLRVMTREPLAQLCRTAIIRDETVAAMSIDLAEEQRFTFVRTALGTDALDDVTRRGKDVLAAFKQDVQAASDAYNKARAGVTELVAEIAQARSQLADQADVEGAEQIARHAVGQEIDEPARLLAAGRQRVAAIRGQQDALLRIAAAVEAIRVEVDVFDGAAAAGERGAVAARRGVLQQEFDEAAAELAQLQASAAVARSAASYRAQLASLYEAGRALGRRADACPLCATAMPQSQFDAALTALAATIAEADRDAASVRTRLSGAEARAASLRAELSTLETRTRRAVAVREELDRRLALAAEQAGAQGVAVEDRADPPAIRAHVQQQQVELDALANAVAVLEASAAVERVADLERRLEQARQDSDLAEARLRRIEAAEARAKRLLNGVRRAVGEVVEERLAALDPLLKDLYARLRPHSDWTELNYRVRGEVRKFLSLRVGDEVNPRFTFSSGQRRAIGLAFLLAVHLSRPWCRLKSLILDDPVQHIDDFRSLHLVEVLGAVRRAGQQIICAVEDEELADLLCRRVRTGKEGEGLLVHMAYRAGDGATLAQSSVVPTAARHLVVPA